MSIIQKIRANGSIDASQLIELFEEVAENGHVLIVKSDGPRAQNRYSCIISKPDDPANAIRRDGDKCKRFVRPMVSVVCVICLSCLQ